MLHLILHFLIPFVVAKRFSSKAWLKVWGIMSATQFVDLDHLLANPIYDPLRCSINFHPLHTYWAIGVYCGMLLVPQLRWVSLGLLIHMLLDWQECWYKLPF